MSGISVDQKNASFRVVVDDFTGGYIADVAPDRIADNEYPKLIDGLIQLPGPVKSRGKLAFNSDGAAGAIVTAGTSSAAIRQFLGTKATNAGAVLPVCGLDDTNNTLKGQISAAAVTVASGTTVSSSLFAGPSTTVEDVMFCPTSTGTVVAIANADPAASSGTISVGYTNSSKAITSAAAFSSSMVGKFLIVGSSAATYRVAAYTDASNMTLDKTYTGTTLSANTVFVVATEAYLPTSQDTTAVKFYACTSAWGRMVMGNVILSGGGGLPGGLPLSKTSRLMWTGIAGSSEGTAPLTGIKGVSFNSTTNEGGYLAVFCQRTIVIVRGTPNFADYGSLDASTIYRGYYLSNPDNFCVTPYGIVFYDQYKGLHIIEDGGSPPRSLSVNKVDSFLTATPPTNLGYASNHVFLLGGGTGNQLMYSFVRDAFVKLSCQNLVSAIPGRGATEELVSLDLTSGKIVNVGGMLTHTETGSAVTDDVGSSKGPSLEFATKYFGEPVQLLTPDTVHVNTKNPGTTFATTISNGYLGAGSTDTFTAAAETLQATQHHAPTTTTQGHEIQLSVGPITQCSSTFWQGIIDGGYDGEGD